MKGLFSLVVAFALLMLLSPPALADEPPRYNFASIQSSKEIRVTPGGEGRASIYFYNIDGNRITHITLEVARAPDGWQVEIYPPRAESRVEVNGRVVTVSENLYVEPSVALSEMARDVPAGMVCVPVAGQGYALAKEAVITVHVPAAEKIGARGEVIIAANARWLGQSGAAVLSQSRDFKLTVEVVPKLSSFRERVLGREGILDRWWLAILAGALIILGVLLVPLYMRRRHG